MLNHSASLFGYWVKVVELAPEHRVPNRDWDDKTDYREFFWEKNSLKYKLMQLIGSFYIYNTPEGVAKHSDIQIK